MSEKLVPKIKRSIEEFLSEEEGNITRNKILTVGSMMLIMGVILAAEAFAAHSSHSSHKSHSSHSSHKSHSSHSSHSSGSYHSSHSSHSNTHSSHSSHSNATTPTRVEVPIPSMDGIAINEVPASEPLALNETLTTSFVLPDTPKIK